ncbi:MAG: hypothetical protein M1383_05245 [Patescibacteria group bacterium]|nr:hypothetical protein [Patescibacteria group bacterium]
MKNRTQQGQIIIFALVFLAIIMTAAAAIMNYTTVNLRGERQALQKDQALYLAEAGLDKAVDALNQDPNYSGESNTVLGSGVFTVLVTALSGNSKIITSTGYIPDSSNPQSARTVKAVLSVDDSVIAFNYGVQAGNGGFVMSGGSAVNGNIYSNGNIAATNGVHITGSATAANPPALAPDQVNNNPPDITACSGTNCIIFANTTATQDFAQSFRISAATPLNNVQFYLKKVGSPSNAVVKIVNDNSGSPGTEVLLSGTLAASAVTANFGWITVTMPSAPVLDPSQTYWLVIDASSNSSKYYIIGANNNGYANGQAKVGRFGSSWSDTSPAGLDGYFQIYLGGGTSTIGGSTYVGGVYIGSGGQGDAWAHTVAGASVEGNLYCQTGSHNNKACDMSRGDPSPEPMPLSDQNIQDWKNEAAAGGTIAGDHHIDWQGGSLGPIKITGNLLVDGGGTLTVTGTLWVEGNITLTGGGNIRLSPSYGASSGAIVSDGYVVLNGGSDFYGSGVAGSYPFLITTSACPVAPGCGGYDAVSMSGGAGSVVVVAQNGNVHISGGSALKELTAKQITMDGGATLIYDSGLISSDFSTGPGGSWAITPDSYVIVP